MYNSIWKIYNLSTYNNKEFTNKISAAVACKNQNNMLLCEQYFRQNL